ncbi:hypothetical protein ACI2OX_04235 [Bacillus sp. N9]
MNTNGESSGKTDEVHQNPPTSPVTEVEQPSEKQEKQSSIPSKETAEQEVSNSPDSKQTETSEEMRSDVEEGKNKNVDPAESPVEGEE